MYYCWKILVGNVIVEGLIGMHCVTRRNENEERMIGLCVERDSDWNYNVWKEGYCFEAPFISTFVRVPSNAAAQGAAQSHLSPLDSDVKMMGDSLLVGSTVLQRETG